MLHFTICAEIYFINATASPAFTVTVTQQQIPTMQQENKTRPVFTCSSGGLKSDTDILIKFTFGIQKCIKVMLRHAETQKETQTCRTALKPPEAPNRHKPFTQCLVPEGGHFRNWSRENQTKSIRSMEIKVIPFCLFPVKIQHLIINLWQIYNKAKQKRYRYKFTVISICFYICVYSIIM